MKICHNETKICITALDSKRPTATLQGGRRAGDLNDILLFENFVFEAQLYSCMAVGELPMAIAPTEDNV